MVIAIVPALVAVAAALVYGLSANAKVAELARLAYAASMFVLLWSLASRVLRLG